MNFCGMGSETSANARLAGVALQLACFVMGDLFAVDSMANRIIVFQKASWLSASALARFFRFPRFQDLSVH